MDFLFFQGLKRLSGRNRIIVNYVIDPFIGTSKLCMTRKPLDCANIIAGNVARPCVIVVQPKNVLYPKKDTSFPSESAKIVLSMLQKMSKSFYFNRVINSLVYSNIYRKKSLARYYDMKHCVRYMSYDDSRKMMLTVGPDQIIKVWSIKGIL